MNTHDIVIAGGGIAGLYCARQLADAGHRILILEASSDRWGGRIETEDLDGSWPASRAARRGCPTA